MRNFKRQLFGFMLFSFPYLLSAVLIAHSIRSINKPEDDEPVDNSEYLRGYKVGYDIALRDIRNGYSDIQDRLERKYNKSIANSANALSFYTVVYKDMDDTMINAIKCFNEYEELVTELITGESD